ncbi:hypothetical protein HDU93_001621 [Gonapodya sp. JEL0774]|nr:hypothetical protein HDU93_001621 [Gonapodya sp. JEL0774]
MAATTTAPIAPLSHAEIEGIVETLTLKLDRYYVLDGIAAQIGAVLKGKLTSGEYDKLLEDSSKLAEVLTEDVRSVNGDKHLRVTFSPTVIEEEEDLAKQSEEEEEEGPEDESKWPPMYVAFSEMMGLHGNGFYSVRRLDGNVGYFDMHSMIIGQARAERALRSAFELIQYTHALIIDLRRCIGGAGETGVLLQSYLFEHATPVTAIYWKPANKTKTTSTKETVDGVKYLNKPVYILTSPSTFSAAEALAVVLQGFKRAVVVGQTTAGGGHPCGFVRAGHDHFQASISIGRTICLATDKGWEGVGCIPDIPVEPLPGFVAGSTAVEDVVLETAQLEGAKATFAALSAEPDEKKSRGKRQVQDEAAKVVKELEEKIKNAKQQAALPGVVARSV